MAAGSPDTTDTTDVTRATGYGDAPGARATHEPAGGDGGSGSSAGAVRRSEDVPHAMGIREDTRASLDRRLARIRGQVEGLRRMIAEERYCPDVLQQFAAVRSALKSAERELLSNHLERCATRAIGAGGASAEEAREEILGLLVRYLD